jgi:hypothetical protein
MTDPDKKMLRNIKRELKKRGNRHRRRQLDRDLQKNPEESHFAEEDLGGYLSETMNKIDNPPNQDLNCQSER